MGPELEIQTAIRIRLSEMGVLLFRNAVVRADQWREQGGRLHHTAPLAGLGVGSADLVGVCEGRFFALEVKAPRGRVQPEQEQWLALVRKHHGFACVVRSVDEAVQAVERCRKGACE